MFRESLHIAYGLFDVYGIFNNQIKSTLIQTKHNFYVENLDDIT